MGINGQNYKNVSGEEEIEDIFLVIVDFKDSEFLNEGEYSLNLTLSGENVEEVFASELKFNVKNKRKFEISTSSTNVKFGDEFTINYTMEASSGTETIFSNKKVSIVLTANEEIPEDTYIVQNGVTYYHNSNNQFIIPCLNVLDGSSSITLSIHSDTLEHIGEEYSFNVDLWVGDTSNAELPFMGEKKARSIFGSSR